MGRRKLGRPPKNDDARLQSWLEWYDRNQQRSEYRRQWYALLTEEQREQRRANKRELYRKRIAEGWHGPYRKNHTDNVVWRELLISLVIQRDGKICGLCGKEVQPGEEQIDHIMPRNMGGSNTAENVRLTHYTCNIRRPKKPKDLRLQLELGPKKEALN